MKIFFPPEHYNKDFRGMVFPLLKPFLKSNNFTDAERREMYGITEKDFSFTESLQEADLVILTMAWNYYLKTGKTYLATKLVESSAINGKKVFIYNSGDYGLKLPFFENATVFRSGGYRHRLRPNERVMPPFIEDPLNRFYRSQSLLLRDYRKIPFIGFCGQANPGRSNALAETIRKSWLNLKFYLGQTLEEPQVLMSSSYLRARILNKLEQSDRVKTNFIRRKQYRAGVKNEKKLHSTTKEFYDNIYNTDYVVCARGVGNFSIRFYETLAMGRIPIYVNTNAVLPLEDQIDWRNHVVWIEKKDLVQIDEKVEDFHRNLSPKSFVDLQLANRDLWVKNLTLNGFFQKMIR